MGWKNLKLFSKTNQEPETIVSVIVAVRNEEEYIENLLKCLISQDYPVNKFEIILVDDTSTDNTGLILNRFSENRKNIFVYSLPLGVYGKKPAVTFALEKAKGSLIVTTDGDCSMGEKWLSTIVSFYERYKPKMIVAPVFYHNEKNIFEKVQSLEFSSLIASGAGAIGINRPILCNAANMAFAKSIVTENKDLLNKKITSGDDVFLLHNLKKTDKKNIRFLKSADAVVYTNPQPDLRSFVSQRIRWSGKSKHYSDTDSIVTALLTFSINLVLVLSGIAGFFNKNYFILFGLILLTKTMIELLFMQSFLSFFKRQKLLVWFIPLQLIYFAYVSFIGIFGFFVKVNWKGRKIVD